MSSRCREAFGNTTYFRDSRLACVSMFRFIKKHNNVEMPEITLIKVPLYVEVTVPMCSAAPRVSILAVITLEFTLWCCDITKGHETLLLVTGGNTSNVLAVVVILPTCKSSNIFLSRKLKLFWLLLFFLQQAVSKGLNMLRCFYFSLIAAVLESGMKGCVELVIYNSVENMAQDSNTRLNLRNSQ